MSKLVYLATFQTSLRDMLKVLTEDVLAMESTLLLRRYGNGNTCWHGADSVKLSRAQWLLEKLKLELSGH